MLTEADFSEIELKCKQLSPDPMIYSKPINFYNYSYVSDLYQGSFYL